ncbi:hypothetical protein BDQ17DRAFT_1332513 [Cyathus striatus]|nr:hypothetical protein BDQ17DRAFT_1332513 [Cyathus striatus]
MIGMVNHIIRELLIHRHVSNSILGWTTAKSNEDKAQKTSEMKRAEDAAADEEGVSDLTVAERVLEESSLPVAPPKWGPSSDVPQPAAPVFTVTLEEEQESDGYETNNKSENKVIFQRILKVQVIDQVITSFKPNKKHTEDQISKGKESDKSNDNHTEDSTSKNKEGDIMMTSPPVSPPHVTSKPGMVDTVDIANISPKGSSRSEGGILRGNALGNYPNAADFHSAVENTAVGPVKGWVWLYVSNADPSTVMVPGVASFTLKHNLTVTIGSVLKKLKDKAKHFFTADCCLYVYESKAWNILGNFESAVKDDEEVDWLRIDGKHILPILSSGFMPNAPLSLDIEHLLFGLSQLEALQPVLVLFLALIPLLSFKGVESQSNIPRDILESTAPGLRVAYRSHHTCHTWVKVWCLSEHEHAYDEKQGYYMVHLNSAKYLKVGKKLWVDRAFSQGVLNAYMEYWNNGFGNGKEISRRQVWKAFIHEPICTVSAGSGVNFISPDGPPTTALTEEAFASLIEKLKTHYQVRVQ